MNGGQVKSWTDLAQIDLGNESERDSIALSFVPQRDGNECALDPSAPTFDNLDSPSEGSSSEDEETLRIYFSKGPNYF